MQSIFKCIIFLSVLAYSNSASAQWQSIGFGSDDFFESIHFVNGNTGFLSGDERIFRTEDSGENWEIVYQFPDTVNVGLRDVTSLNDTTIFVAGRHATRGESMIIKSVDGGNNWYDVFVPPSAVDALNDIVFVNDTLGFAAGNGGTLLKTYDSGEHWEKLPINTDVFLNALYFSDENKGLVVGGLQANTTSIFRTTDGGATWTEVETDALYKFLTAIHFPSLLVGYIVGWEETVLKTTDGGENWQALSCDYEGGQYYDVNFINEQEGYLVGLNSGEGFIKHTIDGGLNWNTVDLDTIDVVGMFSLDFINDNLAYAAGAFGVVLKMNSTTPVDEITDQVYRELLLYPNPVNDQLYFASDHYKNIEVFNSTGKRVLIAENADTIDCSQLPSGHYFIKALGKGKPQYVSQFIKL